MKSTRLTISLFITVIGAFASIVFVTLAVIFGFQADSYYPDLGHLLSAIEMYGLTAPIIISGILLIIGLVLLTKEYLQAKD